MKKTCLLFLFLSLNSFAVMPELKRNPFCDSAAWNTNPSLDGLESSMEKVTQKVQVEDFYESAKAKSESQRIKIKQMVVAKLQAIQIDFDPNDITFVMTEMRAPVYPPELNYMKEYFEYYQINIKLKAPLPNGATELTGKMEFLSRKSTRDNQYVLATTSDYDTETAAEAINLVPVTKDAFSRLGSRERRSMALTSISLKDIQTQTINF